MGKTLICPEGRCPFRIAANDLMNEKRWDAGELQKIVMRAADAGVLPLEQWMASEIRRLTNDPPPAGGPDVALELASRIWEKLYRKMHGELFPYLQVVTAADGFVKQTVHVPDGFVEALCRRLAAPVTHHPQRYVSAGVPKAFLRFLALARWHLVYFGRDPVSGKWLELRPTSWTPSPVGRIPMMNRVILFPVLTFEPVGTPSPSLRYSLSSLRPELIRANITLWRERMMPDGAGLNREKADRSSVLDWDTLCEPQWLDFLKLCPIDLGVCAELSEEETVKRVLGELFRLSDAEKLPRRPRSAEQLEQLPEWKTFRELRSKAGA